jgi:hypothetical protein
MWNEEKQQELLKAQELVQQLERERNDHNENIAEQLVEAITQLDRDGFLYYNDCYTYARFLLRHKQDIIALLENIK